MFYVIVSTIVVLLSFLGLGIAAKLLFRKGWILGWLRGTLGVLLCIVAGTFALAAVDLYSYKQVMMDKPIATVSFKKVSDQNYMAEFDWTDSEESENIVYNLSGDQWQLDARIIRWHGFIRRMGAKPGYRFERISGRYNAIEDEQTKERTVHGLNNEGALLDIWSLLKSKDESLTWVDAVYGNATFVPMADEAKYEVSLSDSGLVAKPLNRPALEAVSAW